MDILQWMIDIPLKILDVCQQFIYTLNMDAADAIYGIIPKQLGWLIPGYNLFSGMTLLDVVIGVGLPVVLLWNIIKWIIGIIT